MYYNGTNYVRLAKGTTGQVLTQGASAPAWAADSTDVTGTAVGGSVKVGSGSFLQELKVKIDTNMKNDSVFLKVI